MKAVLIVLDGFGIGESPDAKVFGDEGSNTFLNTNKQKPFNIPNLEKLGFKNIDGINLKTNEEVVGCYARLEEISMGKDTTTGHLEMSGVVLEKPYPTFEGGLTKEIIKIIEGAIGVKTIGHKAISGTTVIKELGEKHIKTKYPIVYTSADSVVQIATHDSIYSIEELYDMCKKTREALTGENAVGRVIARPFSGETPETYYRLPYRKDYGLNPPGLTMLKQLTDNNYEVYVVGKLNDVFNNQGITKTIPAKNNQQGLDGIKQAIKDNPNGLIFANLIDTDMLFGHRNDVEGYVDSVEKVDVQLKGIVESLNDDDLLLITADHGNDPTTPSTDHSREYVPLVMYSKRFKNNVNLGTLRGFNNISNIILTMFKLKNDPILNKLRKD